MLYVYFGKNVVGAREKALLRARTLSSESMPIERITSDTYAEGILNDLAKSPTLFGGTKTVLLDTPSENELFADAVYSSLNMLAESSHHFVLIEHVLSVSQKKECTRYAECTEETAPQETKEEYNAFRFCDALLERDKKKLWLLFMESDGVPREEIIGILMWQLKVLRLAEKCGSADEAGLKPFVYQKAKRALVKFKQGDVERLSFELLTLYHLAHLGKCDMNTELEKWFLSV